MLLLCIYIVNNNVDFDCFNLSSNSLICVLIKSFYYCY